MNELKTAGDDPPGKKKRAECGIPISFHARTL